MKRHTIHPKVDINPHDYSRGPMGSIVAQAILKEDPEGAWVRHEEAEAAIKKATENAGTVTLRQRYKVAALPGVIQLAIDAAKEGRVIVPSNIVAHAAEVADAMLAEDEEHAKK